MQRLALIGTGLMGGSLGLAVRRAGLATVTGYDTDPAALATAHEHDCLDQCAANLASACEHAAIVVVCAPLAELGTTINIALTAAPEATVTDMGSAKGPVLAAIAPAHRARFVGGHPICGAETHGAQHATATLFEGATWFLTPTAETDATRHRDLHRLIVGVGAVPSVIDAAAHDRLFALVSHLPHALANLLVTQAGDARIAGHDPLAASGGSFRDMTRVAGANPRIWVDIFLENRVALADALREHRRSTDELLAALDAGDAGYLARWIGQSASHRKRALAAQFDSRPEDLFRVHVNVPSRPGVFAGITQALGAARINIEDFEVHHVSNERGGTIDITVAGEEQAQRTVELLEAQGYGALAAPILEGELP